jgi:adenylate cyclase
MIFSLQRRFLLLLLLPVALLLLAVGVAGFFYARAFLLDQWVEVTRLKLEKAAHQIDLRLHNNLDLIKLIVKAEDIPDGHLTQAFLIQQLSERKGIRFVDIVRFPAGVGRSSKKEETKSEASTDIGGGLYTLELCGDFGFCAPTTVTHAGDRALRIVANLGKGERSPRGRLVVRISFDSFLEPIRDLRLWEGTRVALVTSTGQLLASSDKSWFTRRQLADTGNELEKQLVKEIRQRPFGTVFGKGHPPAVIAGFYKIPSINWYIILFSPGRAVMRPIVSFRFYYVVQGIVAIVVILLLIRLATRSVGRSIGKISAAAEKVQEGDYSVSIPEDRSDEIGLLSRRFNEMIAGLRQRDIIQRTFGRYVDRAVAEELMSKPEALRLGGEIRTVTIMMSDLRDFTQMSEKLRPEEVIKMLNRYFARMIAVIERYKGIIVDFYGDSILVFFDGVTSDVPKRAMDAVNCALEMQKAMQSFVNENVELGLPPITMGIGIHTGEVIVGNIGTESRAKYGIVGSNVNLTDRIQYAATGGKVVVSEETYERICAKLGVATELFVCLKGVEEDKKLYEIDSVEPLCLPEWGASAHTKKRSVT